MSSEEQNQAPRAEPITERTRRTTAMLILRVLETQSPMHGYGIQKALELESGGAIRYGEAKIYPALRVLEREGLIVGEWVTSTNGVPRKEFTITAAGLDELHDRAPALQRFFAAAARLLGGEEA